MAGRSPSSPKGRGPPRRGRVLPHNRSNGRKARISGTTSGVWGRGYNSVGKGGTDSGGYRCQRYARQVATPAGIARAISPHSPFSRPIWMPGTCTRWSASGPGTWWWDRVSVCSCARKFRLAHHHFVTCTKLRRTWRHWRLCNFVATLRGSRNSTNCRHAGCNSRCSTRLAGRGRFR